MLFIFGLGPSGYPPKSVSSFSIEIEFLLGRWLQARYNLRTKSMGTKVGQKKNVCKLRL